MAIRPSDRDARCARPMSDSERVLGQIARGEVRAGPEAAREIAARHQEAYGDVWDALFADALASALGGEDR